MKAKARRTLAASAGPLLIAASTMVVLRGFWLFDRLSSQQVDVMAFWLPRWCAMGNAVSSGHIPTWLTNQFAGVPFASDPQSGWLYFPVMILFGLFSCWRAMTLLITLQPVLAGLGVYWFLRNEGVGRPAATVGGLTLALTMAGSTIALSMPFAGTLAWTALALAGVAGYLHHRSAVGMLGWLAFTGLAWSQIAAAHLTDGLLIGTSMILLYAAVRSVIQVQTGVRSWRAAGLMGLALLVALPLLSAAALVPRLDLLPRTSIAKGYLTLTRLTNSLAGRYARPPFAVRGVSPLWITSFARGPGGYVGAVALLLSPIALAGKRWRWPAAAFALAGVVGFVLNLDVLIGSAAVRSFVTRLGLGELWLRDPYRFRYVLVLAFAGLAGYGLQTWLDWARVDGAALLKRMLWLIPVLVVFVLVPLAAGVALGGFAVLLLGLVIALPMLLLDARYKASWGPALLAGLVAVELTVAGVAGQYNQPPKGSIRGARAKAAAGRTHSFPKMATPSVEETAYLTPGRIGRTLIGASGDGGRYLSFNAEIARRSSRGFLSHQEPSSWPAYANGRSILFGLEEVQGYSPVQLFRYWKLVRATNTTPIFYNSSTFQSIQPSVLRLLGIEWIITPVSAGPPLPGAKPVAREARYELYRVPDAQPRASIAYQLRRLDEDEVLEAVLLPSFDPAQIALVEPGAPSIDVPFDASSARGTARYSEPAPNHARIAVSSSEPGLLVVRNVVDEEWQAKVDGRPAPVLTTDYLLQGVPIPAGTHVVDLEYRDTAIGLGAAVAGLAWLLLLCVLGWLLFRGRRGRERGPPTEPF